MEREREREREIGEKERVGKGRDSGCAHTRYAAGAAVLWVADAAWPQSLILYYTFAPT